MYNLERMYEQGDAVAQDYEAALDWYEKAHALGHTVLFQWL